MHTRLIAPTFDSREKEKERDDTNKIFRVEEWIEMIPGRHFK